MSAAASEAMARPVLRYQGGKFRMARWLIALMPVHRMYVEPFGGGASVLLSKPRSESEVYNDLDGDVVTFFRVLRDPVQRAALMERVSLTPFARAEFDLSYEPTTDPVECAARLCIRSWMGYGSAGATKGTTGLRTAPKDVKLWSRCPEALAAVGTRLDQVLIEQKPAIDVMLKYDAPDALHYVDPPYVFSTRDPNSRSSRRPRYYRHEMSDWEHVQLLSCLQNLKGTVILSGYHCALYDDCLQSWRCLDRQVAVNSGRGGAVSRTESVWINRSST